ncbi:hypothetical protein CFSAN001628_009683 [Clostridium botulinum CFSAN001628]|nr:hypothetical protein CFSAN001628_009683 [Clostridium botulinum CFSAN001628]
MLSLFLFFVLNAENKFIGIITGRKIIYNIADRNNRENEGNIKKPLSFIYNNINHKVYLNF